MPKQLHLAIRSDRPTTRPTTWPTVDELCPVVDVRYPALPADMATLETWRPRGDA